MGGQHGDPGISTVINLLCSPYVHAFSSPTLQAKCSILLNMSPKSAGFIKCRHRCLNLNAAKALQSQRTRKDFQTPVCIYHIQDCLPVPVHTNVPLNECPVIIIIIIPSWLLIKLNNSPALLADGLLRRSLAFLCPQMDCQYASCFLLVQPLITQMATFADKPTAGSGPITGSEETCLANLSAISFPSMPYVPAPTPLAPCMF